VIIGARPDQVIRSTVLHLGRFADFFEERYGHERISTVLKRDVEAWIALLSDHLALAPATVNSHLASLSKFCSWADAQHRDLFACGNPMRDVRELPLPALEPQALSPAQILLLKSVCDRLPRFHERKGRRDIAHRRTTQNAPAVHRHARPYPYRDRAIVYLLLATGLRREELVNLNLDQVVLGSRSDAPAKKPVTDEARRASSSSCRYAGKTAPCATCSSRQKPARRWRITSSGSDRVMPQNFWRPRLCSCGQRACAS
jgi:integrase